VLNGGKTGQHSRWLGYVDAPDPDSAIAEAAKEFRKPASKLVAAKRGGEVFPSFPKPGRTLISIAAAYQGWKQQVRVVRWLLAAILLAAILVYRGPYAFTECACGGSKRRADLKWATPCYYSVCC